AVYALFSLIAALAMWSLARRFVPDRAFPATLLFLAVPTFVVNGNSLEADLPLLAMWMAAIALFVKGIDGKSRLTLAASGVAGTLAALDAYQGVLLAPILALYLWPRRRSSILAWVAVLSPPTALAIWQIFERATSGSLPANVVAGYMSSYGLQQVIPKLKHAV